MRLLAVRLLAVRARAAGWFVVGLTLAGPLRAQHASQSRVGVPGTVAPANVATPCTASLVGGCAGSAGPGRRGRDDLDVRRWAPVASLLLPGLGQAVLRQDRFVAYLAVEAWALLEFANQRTEAGRQQNRYRDLARDVARSLVGPRAPVGTWAYYEAMEHYVESGVFDRLPGGDVDPELDVDTHNGAMWLLARQTYWADPAISPPASSVEYRSAYNFYLDRAIRSEYRWSWRNAQLQQDVYVRTIRRSNTAFREARQVLGFVIANHLLSSVDAFVTLRVEGLEGGSGRGVAVRGRWPLP